MSKFLRPLFRASAILVIVVSMGALPSMPASASTASYKILGFSAEADALVKSATPDANFGTSVDLRARSSPVVRSYLRFTVSGVAGLPIVRARLQVYANNSVSSALVVHPVSDDTWSETGITYNNAPSFGAALAKSPAVSAGTWVTLDVTKYVKSEGVYSFALTTPSLTVIGLASREFGAHPPRLLISLDTWQPSFPIRATFYYPWFPEAWKQNGVYPYTNYQPSLSYYSSTDAIVLQQHLAMMQYGHIEAGIASWWGQGSQTDSKIAGLLNAAAGTNFRWALYYENEAQGDPSVSQIQNDLLYIRNHYGQNPSFLRIRGKFVVFVYSDGNDDCGMVDRWRQANTVGAYVVLKVFEGYRNCARQPNGWHQYAPALADTQQGRQSYSVSPGFWQVGHSVLLKRDVTRWTQNVQDMVASGAHWQLITTFSEWGEGTAVEPAVQWSSTSGYGQYLDVLHDNPVTP